MKTYVLKETCTLTGFSATQQSKFANGKLMQPEPETIPTAITCIFYSVNVQFSVFTTVLMSVEAAEPGSDAPLARLRVLIQNGH